MRGKGSLITRVAGWLFVLCLPLLFLSASIAWWLNSLWLYESGFARYGVSQVTGLSPSELDKAARGLISYFNSGEETINITVVKDGQPLTLFNQREVSHLRDVKSLIWLDYHVLLGTLIYALLYAVFSSLLIKNWRRLARGAVAGSALTLALMLALVLGTLLDFDQLFLQFHILSFANDFWRLDPSRDYLIMLFPGGFWYDAALYVTLSALAGALISGGVAGVFLLSARGTPGVTPSG